MSVTDVNFAERLKDEAKRREGDLAQLTHDLAMLAGNLREGNGVIDRAFNEILDIIQAIPGADANRINRARESWAKFAAINPPGCPPGGTR